MERFLSPLKFQRVRVWCVRAYIVCRVPLFEILTLFYKKKSKKNTATDRFEREKQLQTARHAPSLLIVETFIHLDVYSKKGKSTDEGVRVS